VTTASALSSLFKYVPPFPYSITHHTMRVYCLRIPLCTSFPLVFSHLFARACIYTLMCVALSFHFCFSSQGLRVHRTLHCTQKGSASVSGGGQDGRDGRDGEGSSKKRDLVELEVHDEHWIPNVIRELLQDPRILKWHPREKVYEVMHGDNFEKRSALHPAACKHVSAGLLWSVCPSPVGRASWNTCAKMSLCVLREPKIWRNW